MHNLQGEDSPLSVWPHLFRGGGHEKRMGEQLKWSLALGCTSVRWKFSMCTATRTSSYSPAFGPSVFFCVFSLGFACVFICAF